MVTGNEGNIKRQKLIKTLLEGIEIYQFSLDYITTTIF